MPEQTTITYKMLVNDDRLKKATRTACNFWNSFIAPKGNTVLRMGSFNATSDIIAQAYKPFERSATTYGQVEFNATYLSEFDDDFISGIIIHEMGHVLGIGWDKWMDLFDPVSFKFKPEYIDKVPYLLYMAAESKYGEGTKYAHWAENEWYMFEIMTGIADINSFVLPVTISVMELLGHKVIKPLRSVMGLTDVLREVEGIQYMMLEEAKKIDKEHHQETPVWEEIYI